MYYEINVSKNGQHFFATSERSIATEKKLIEVYLVFKDRFPEAEGFSLSMSCYRHTGSFIDEQDLNL